MAFFAHRCRRATCNHPDYFAAGARERGSVTRGQTFEGQPTVEWAAQQPGGQMLRGSCGLCPSCARGCDYDTEVYEVEQYKAGGYGVVETRLVKPGEKTTNATAPAPQYACNCDACQAAYAGDPRSM